MRVLAVVLILAAGSSVFAQQNSNPQPKAAAQESSMTGFLDQEGSSYILREGSEMKKIADLEPVGFTADNFAKYVGGQVKVYGKISGDGATKRVRVTRVEKLGS